MDERLETFAGGRLGDVLSVVLPNGVILAAVNLTPVNQTITLLAGLVTIGYAVWRWRRDSYVLCQGCREGRTPEICPLPKRRRPSWCPRFYD
jgi:hypothetical protein